MSKKNRTTKPRSPVAAAATRLSYGSGAHGPSKKALRNRQNREIRMGCYE